MLMWGSNARAAPHLLPPCPEGDPPRACVSSWSTRGGPRSAEWGDLWLGIDVGTDIALSNTMAREIIVNDLHDKGFIEHATLGFEAYRDSVMDWTLGARGARSPGCRPT